MASELKAFIVRWSNDHPLDKGFREKYNIPFNSQKHRETNQLDVLCEYLENSLTREYEERIEKEDKRRKLFDKGIWLSENSTEEQTVDLFDNLDISSINKQSQLQIEDDE